MKSDGNMEGIRTAILLAAALVAATRATAQEVVELDGRDRHLEPAFEELFRVGVLDGEPWEMFATVAKVAFDARGNLYVFDRGPGSTSPDLRVVILGRSGAFVREFGSAGEAPGEFKQPRSYAVLHDATIPSSGPSRIIASTGRMSKSAPLSEHGIHLVETSRQASMCPAPTAFRISSPESFAVP